MEPPAQPPPGPSGFDRAADRSVVAVGNGARWLAGRSAAVILGVCLAISVALGALVLVVSRALFPPTTTAELCRSYDHFLQEWLHPTSSGFFDPAAFRTLDDLAEKAGRYRLDAGVEADGDRLRKLSKGDRGRWIVSVSTSEAIRASRHIDQVCNAGGD